MSKKMERAAAFKDKGAFSVEEFAEWAGIGRTLAFAELKSGRLVARKCGRRTIIPSEEAQRWLQQLPGSDQAATAKL